ncbi:hypothetical protein H4R99_000270 [Coemansia sp. RSA 1722]|nr:hypothetical protein IWW45_000178 [Coemansia sp. RSA 485]KAJ2606636.1 hypothetical protein H4R99_000270 [Coemansia sp. RSA 1722]
MRDQRAHFTEPARHHLRPPLSVAIDAHAAQRGAMTYGPASSSPTDGTSLRFHEAIEIEDEGALAGAARHANETDDEAKGCVPTHRSVFRLLRRKLQAHRRTSSSVSHVPALGMRATASAGTNIGAEASGSTSSASFDGGYLRSNKTNRAVTLSAQRTRSEFAIAGPPPLEGTRSELSGPARNPRQPQLLNGAKKPGAQTHPRAQRADKGTIVQLRSTPSTKKIAIPAIDGLRAEIAESIAASSVGSSAASEPASADIDIDIDIEIENISDADADADAETEPDRANTPQTADSTPASIKATVMPSLSDSRLHRPARFPRSPRKSVSSISIGSPLAKQLEIDVEHHTVSDDELMVTTNADVAVHVLPDDSSDWNSDFSSPSSWRRSSDRPVSRRLPYRLDPGIRLKDRAIDRGVLEAQHRILQQEKYLMQISNLSSCLAKLRPLILRCLVFELPDRGIRVGTSAFVSSIREPCGSIEPSIEEERLWELWRQAEALLTIMDNDNIPASNIESRLTLSKKRAIMLAFSDWEQYSMYVQDAWDKARRGIDQPDAEQESRPSISNDSAYDDPRSPGALSQGHGSTPRTSYDGCSVISSLSPTSPRTMIRFSLSRHRKSRRRSVVGVAPASLQRIADEATAIRDECEQLLMLMSPLYRENQLSPRNTMTSFSPPANSAASFLASETRSVARPSHASAPPVPSLPSAASANSPCTDAGESISMGAGVSASAPCSPSVPSAQKCANC